MAITVYFGDTIGSLYLLHLCILNEMLRRDQEKSVASKFFALTLSMIRRLSESMKLWIDFSENCLKFF